MSDNKLKIDVVLADVGESGAVLSDFVTQELHNTDMAKKADLVNGKVNPTQLPEFSELSGVTDVFSQLENNLREDINTSLTDSKAYADSIVSEVMSKKADLVNGRVPKEQATNFKDIPGAKAAIDGLKQSLGQEIIGINDSLENNFAKLTNGTVSKTLLPTDLVYSDRLTREMNDVRRSLQNTITQVDEELTALETKTNNKFISKTEAEYFTKDIELKAAIDGLEQKSYTSYASKIVETSKADLTYVNRALGALSSDATKFYPTLALANSDIANLQVNQPVQVGEVENGGLWYKVTADATSLTKSPYDPLTQSKIHTNFLINLLKNSLSFLQLNSHNLNTGEKIWLSIQDKFLRSVFSVGEKNLQWNSLNFRLEITSKSIKITDKIGRTILSLDKNGISFGNSKIIPSLSSIFSDKIGRSAIKINKDGSVVIPQLTVQSIKKQGEFGAISEITASVAQEFPKIGFQTYPNRIGVFFSGQSLNMGGTGFEPPQTISATQPFSNVMFDGGTQSDAWDITYTPNSFVPLVSGARGLIAEFPAINGCNALSRQIDKSADIDANDFSIFCSVIGEGSQSVEQMITKYLPKLKHSITNFKELCDKNGETCEVWALGYIQGEGDSYVNAYEDYASRVMHYMSEAINHVMITTKQATLPYIYIYQQAATQYVAPQNGYKVAQNQWLLSKSVPNVVCFTPMYIFDYIDTVHLTSLDYWFLGEYIGRAIHHTQFANQGKFRPTQPEHIIWTDNYIDIVYHAPKYPIRFTTDVCTQALNQGFCFYKNKQYQAGFISSVELKDYRTVRINLTQAITDPDFEICYARGTNADGNAGRTNGQRGNVADSTRETVTSPTNVSRIISHHSVSFTYHKTNGFAV